METIIGRIDFRGSLPSYLLTQTFLALAIGFRNARFKGGAFHASTRPDAFTGPEHLRIVFWLKTMIDSDLVDEHEKAVLSTAKREVEMLIRLRQSSAEMGAPNAEINAHFVEWFDPMVEVFNGDMRRRGLRTVNLPQFPLMGEEDSDAGMGGPAGGEEIRVKAESLDGEGS